MRSSPSSLTRTGGQSGSGSSQESSAGIQYRRIVVPIGVPGPTLVSRALSSRDSMIDDSFHGGARKGPPNPPTVGGAPATPGGGGGGRAEAPR
jgi:hypothetical protein